MSSRSFPSVRLSLAGFPTGREEPASVSPDRLNLVESF